MTSERDVAKIQQHLTLLRDEFLKLQSKYIKLEQKYNIASASSLCDSEDNFVGKLLRTVADMFEKELYSDLTVIIDGKTIRAHKFVLAARSKFWNDSSLVDIDQLEFEDTQYDVGYCLLKWVYTDSIDLEKRGDSFVLSLMTAAAKYKLTSLQERCEKLLVSSVNIKNCTKFYSIADQVDADTLRNYASNLISMHWTEFSNEDFKHMSADLMYKMLKSKSEFPLHKAIQVQREDVMFLYLIENASRLAITLGERDESGELPLDLALATKQDSVAKMLVDHGADCNSIDDDGRTLLHKACARGDTFSIRFLLNNGCSVNNTSIGRREAAFHEFAALEFINPLDADDIAQATKLLIEKGAQPNIQDEKGCTVLHRAIVSGNHCVFDVLAGEQKVNAEIRNNAKQTALWTALVTEPAYGAESMAYKLVKRGSSIDSVDKETGESLLHLATKSKNGQAAIFLIDNGAQLNVGNNQNQTALHIACEMGLSDLVAHLLSNGANCNQQSTPNVRQMDFVMTDELYGLTPLHLAILHNQTKVVQAILDHKQYSQECNDSSSVIPNFNILDSQHRSVLMLALENRMLLAAGQLIAGGASVNQAGQDGNTLLHHFIIEQNVDAALFLIENGADLTIRTFDHETCLILAIHRHLPKVVEALCKRYRGCDIGAVDKNNNCPLWLALESGQDEIASILVSFGCDTDGWGPGPDDCWQTMIHRAIDENNEHTACFLIRSGCDLNTSRRLSPDGKGGEEARDKQTPLHMAAAWGLENVAQTLLEHNAEINTKDVEGKTPLHIAIANQHNSIIQILLCRPDVDLTSKDKKGQTPFAVAMTTKNNKAARLILDCDPSTAEQYDNRGESFIHLAVRKADIENVLFLLGLGASVHLKTRDSQSLTPLHIAAQIGSDIIIRNLLLAGANINEVTAHSQTALHLAALGNYASACIILLDNEIDFNAVDVNANNALHLAVQKGNLATIKVLLSLSRIDAEAVNIRGQNPMHVLCQYGKENAADIFELFLECMPNYPVNTTDAEGSSGLLLAYMNGNGQLCRSIVRTKAKIGTTNNNGVSIFKYQVATKQLLFRLLDFLSEEPEWSDGDSCSECITKFGITTRKHHCRHCGRVLCSKCSDKDVPILKYKQTKPVRVCETCFNVLTHGTL